MKRMLKKVTLSLAHLGVLHEVFLDEKNYGRRDQLDYELYRQNEREMLAALSKIGFERQLYAQKGRQMILADIFEYMFLGRIYYSLKTSEHRSDFIRAVLHFCNMLMCYEVMTVSSTLRRRFLDRLRSVVAEVGREPEYKLLRRFSGSVGLKDGESDASDDLNDYFDTLLPKTAGGLWHELIVYIYLLRNDYGYIVPLLLSQKLLGLTDHLVPPDFLVISRDKRIYGIEVGRKKEIQSGSFSLRTAIPTATVDTINSRTSDRCPACRKWITFCPYVIQQYSNLSQSVVGRNGEVRCLDSCTIVPKEDILLGKCPHTKYRRSRVPTLAITHHEFGDGRHYHYQCVLAGVRLALRRQLVTVGDHIALKTHFPYYSGLEGLSGEPTVRPPAQRQEADE